MIHVHVAAARSTKSAVADKTVIIYNSENIG